MKHHRINHYDYNLRIEYLIPGIGMNADIQTENIPLQNRTRRGLVTASISLYSKAIKRKPECIVRAVLKRRLKANCSNGDLRVDESVFEISNYYYLDNWLVKTSKKKGVKNESESIKAIK